MGGLGWLGWGALLAATSWPGFGPGVTRSEGLGAFAVFFLVIVAARGMAVRVLPLSVISLDAGFYIAAALCLGSVTAGRLVALALTLDSLVRLVGHRADRGRTGDTWSENLTYVLYFGGMTGALLMSTGWLFEVDAYRPGAGVDSELEVLGLVFAVGLTFLAVHYAIQGARLRLLGQGAADVVRRMAVPGVLAEASLLPLAVVVVLIYRPDQAIGFSLLGATYVLINFVFNRLSDTGAKLEQRVGELEALHETSRELARSLQLHELVETVARETVRAIPTAEILTLAHRVPGSAAGGSGASLIVDSYDRDRRRFERFHIAVGEGASGWILAHRKPLCLADLRRSEFFAGSNADAGVRSWMGVPLGSNQGEGEAEGVLAVQSRQRGVFGEAELRVLEAIGAQTSIALQNVRLYELAMVDGLTKLFVRRYFDARLDEEVQRSLRFETDFSVVMMDIDDFKQLNDTHGHQAGDEVLRRVAAIIKRQMRGVDTAARYGGEEFAMILPRTSMLDAYTQAERIRSLIEEQTLDAAGTALTITASFGIAAYPESGKGDAADVVRRADIALYRAKRTGKNRVELYWAEGQEDARSHIRTA
jgi:diguanylate cyclase (GGDEF)-like protein